MALDCVIPPFQVQGKGEIEALKLTLLPCTFHFVLLHLALMAYSLDGFGFRVCFRGFHYEQLILTFGSYQGDVMFVTCVFTVGIDIVELIWCFCKQKASKEKFSEKPEGPAPS